MAIDIKRVIAAAPRKREPELPTALSTPWGERLDAENVLQQHPRPQFARSSFIMLHGKWDYAFADAVHPLNQTGPEDAPARFDGEILVPFSPEAPLSGVQRQLQPGQHLWYRLRFDVSTQVLGGSLLESAPPHDAGEDAGCTVPARPLTGRPKVVKALGKTLAVKRGHRCLMHFDGVDSACRVWLNGRLVAHGEGCYLPFSAHVDDALVPGRNTLVVCVSDPSETGTQLRGKQQLERGGIWYTAQSGIWQPVWLEAVPETYVQALRIDADAGGNLRIEARTNAPEAPLTVALFPQGGESSPHDVERFSARVDEGNPCWQVAQLHVRGARQWSPEDPALYALEIRCGDDKVHSYCAFRSVSVQPDAQGAPRFFLNGKPYFLRGVLDQGYWPDGLMTAPDDAALEHDVAACKALGFNMARKHLKVENERWYWHCDRLGLLVWQDMPSGGGTYSPWHTSRKPTLFKASWTRQRDDTPRGRARLGGDDGAMREEWKATCESMVDRLRNHPCVCTWVLFNEGWGQFDSREQTAAVHRADPSRPIDAASGWYDQGGGDFFSVHNYFRPLCVWPDSHTSAPRAFVISEFGGLAWHVEGHSSFAESYGYASFEDAGAWRRAVSECLDAAGALEGEGLAGYVYTQLCDVEGETNGLITYDRRVNKLEAR